MSDSSSDESSTAPGWGGSGGGGRGSGGAAVVVATTEVSAGAPLPPEGGEARLPSMLQFFRQLIQDDQQTRLELLRVPSSSDRDDDDVGSAEWSPHVPSFSRSFAKNLHAVTDVSALSRALQQPASVDTTPVAVTQSLLALLSSAAALQRYAVLQVEDPCPAVTITAVLGSLSWKWTLAVRLPPKTCAADAFATAEHVLGVHILAHFQALWNKPASA